MHLAYLYNQRTDNPLNKPAVGVSFSPTASRNVTLIMEYDAQSINIGAMCSLWNEHVNLLFELQECQYLSVGLSFKVNLLGNNYWKNK